MHNFPSTPATQFRYRWNRFCRGRNWIPRISNISSAPFWMEVVQFTIWLAEKLILNRDAVPTVYHDKIRDMTRLPLVTGGCLCSRWLGVFHLFVLILVHSNREHIHFPIYYTSTQQMYSRANLSTRLLAVVPQGRRIFYSPRSLIFVYHFLNKLKLHNKPICKCKCNCKCHRINLTIRYGCTQNSTWVADSPSVISAVWSDSDAGSKN